MRRLWLLGVAMLLQACQTTGNTTGQELTESCDTSPIRSTWSAVYTPTGERCMRKAVGKAPNMFELYGRPFVTPGGQAAVVYMIASPEMYLPALDVVTLAMSYEPIGREARDWSAPRPVVIGDRSYDVVRFAIGTQSCVGFSGYSMPTQGFYRRSAFGWACANRMDDADAGKLLASLEFEG